MTPSVSSRALVSKARASASGTSTSGIPRPRSSSRSPQGRCVSGGGEAPCAPPPPPRHGAHVHGKSRAVSSRIIGELSFAERRPRSSLGGHPEKKGGARPQAVAPQASGRKHARVANVATLPRFPAQRHPLRETGRHLGARSKILAAVAHWNHVRAAGPRSPPNARLAVTLSLTRPRRHGVLRWPLSSFSPSRSRTFSRASSKSSGDYGPPAPVIFARPTTRYGMTVVLFNRRPIRSRRSEEIIVRRGG